jgi:predicted aldo/keto reductase-like oxidoreductase
LLEFLGRKEVYYGNKIDKVESVGKPTDCIGCGLCASHCPQSIDIPDIMQKLAELM